MSIPISSVADVGITIGATFPQRAGFGTLNIVTSDLSVINAEERYRTYANIDGVAEDWGADSEVTRAATSYFSQQPRPTSLVVSVRVSTEGQPARLNGGEIVDSSDVLDDIMNLINTSEGAGFDITINGNLIELRGLGLSGGQLTSFGSLGGLVSFVLNAELSDLGLDTRVSIGIDPEAQDEGVLRYRMIATGSDANETIFEFPVVANDASNDNDVFPLNNLLFFGETQGATIVSSIQGETIAQALTTIDDKFNNWYGLLFTKEVRDDFQTDGINSVISAAEWVEARTKVFLNTSNDPNCLLSTSESDIISQIQARGFRRTMNTYSSFPDQYPSASVSGRAFTVNFDQPDSTITLNFKQLPGITVENLTQNEYRVLRSKNGNAFITVGSSNFFSESFMANGVFFDEVHGIDWLTNAIQTNVFGYLLTRPTKVPYTDQGVAALEQQVINALDRARFNGLIAPGETIDGEFLPNGYKTNTVPVDNIDQGSVEARFYGGLSFTGLGAGAIHSVQINGIFER